MGTDVVFPIQDVLANDFPFFSDKTNLPQLVSCAWVAAVKGRPVLHRCVVIFVWSTGIMDCMLFWFKNRVLHMNLMASVVWHVSLLLMNNFNKTVASISPCKLCFFN